MQLLVSELKRNSANHVTYGQVHHDVSAEINRNSTNQAVVSVGQLHCHDSSNDKFQQVGFSLLWFKIFGKCFFFLIVTNKHIELINDNIVQSKVIGHI